jgi:transcriptional regulator with XRE-family HTH domain
MNHGGKRLREVFSLYGLSVDEVSERTGISSRTIYGWGKTAPVDKLWLITDNVGIPFLELAECFRPTSEPEAEAEDLN